MNKLTLQINNLEALERLIGGNSEIEIDIRNSVVQKFAEKHLKPLANSDTVTKALTQLKESINKQICDQCAKDIAKFKISWAGQITDVVLNPSIKSEIDSQVRTIVDNTIRKDVDAAIKFWANDKEIKDKIDSKFKYYTAELINDEIRRRLEKLKTQL